MIEKCDISTRERLTFCGTLDLFTLVLSITIIWANGHMIWSVSYTLHLYRRGSVEALRSLGRLSSDSLQRKVSLKWVVLNDDMTFIIDES